MASTARNSGAGFSTIPGPPPYATSSTDAVPVVGEVAQVVHPQVHEAALDRPARGCPRGSGRSNIRGKIVTMSNFTSSATLPARLKPRPTPPAVQLEQPLGRIDHDPPGRDVDPHADCAASGISTSPRLVAHTSRLAP